MIIICSAWEKELEHLSSHYDSDRFYKTSLGTGYLEASLNLEKLLAEKKDEKIEEIVFLGTAGSYRKNLEIGDVVQVRKSRLLLLGKLEEKAYTPEKYEDFVLRTLGNSIVIADAMTSMEITNDDITASKIYKDIGQEFLVENMELYGVAHVAAEHKISCFSLLGISNYNNIFANREWENNQEEVSEKLGEALNSVLL